MQTTETRAAQEAINAADMACYAPTLVQAMIVLPLEPGSSSGIVEMLRSRGGG